ncbi:MAG: glyoxylate/hydroxypyruvate reductase A [Proteobacteria bacterium]|nr:glyoxylate/hydroxypyruvate reductase A [Pseudomonadota bacterium]
MPALDFRVWPEVGDPRDIEAALVWKAPEGELRKFPNLKLIINLGAGVDSIVKDPTLPEGIPIVRIADAEMSRMMTQFVLAAVLRHYRDFVPFARAQRERRWHYIHPREAATCSVGVMGLGSLGGMAAAELVRQGFRVAGWARSPKSLEGVESFFGGEGLAPFLARSEILVVMLPLTRETEGILDAKALARLPRGAKLVNVGRGQLVDEDALIAALRSGHVAEATLDVFRTEPLPADSPLWDFDQVLITPHLASVAIPRTAARQVAENLRRVAAGEPLLNVVDPQRGY